VHLRWTDNGSSLHNRETALYRVGCASWRTAAVGQKKLGKGCPLEPHEDLTDAIAEHAIVSAEFEEAERLIIMAKAAYDCGEYRPAASALTSAIDGALTPLRYHVEHTWKERTVLAAVEAAGLSDE
jgi:hypothetical protein